MVLAVTAVKYRVYVRCLGCGTERFDFHATENIGLLGSPSLTFANPLTENMKLVITGSPLTAPEVGYALVFVQ